MASRSNAGCLPRHHQLSRVCVAQIKPTWLKIIDEQGSGLEQCKEGFDPFQLIAVEIDKMILNDFENNMNNFFIRPLNDLLGIMGPIEELCLPAYWDSKRCPKGDTFWEAALGCGVRDATPPHEQCYYKRVRSICMSERGDQYGKYTKLFQASSAESLSSEYASIAGPGAIEEMPPTLLAAFEQVDASKRSGIDDIRESQGVDPGNICDRMDDAMSLDEARKRSSPLSRRRSPPHCPCVADHPGLRLPPRRGPVRRRRGPAGALLGLHRQDRLGDSQGDLRLDGVRF